MVKSKVYTLPPWSREAFWINHHSIWAEHFPHVGLKDPDMLAFTPSQEDGERDRQAIMKPGKYLQKFFGASAKTGKIPDGLAKGCHPILTEKQIAYYAEWWARGSKPSPVDGLEVKITTTPSEAARVYMNGPRSCMGNGGYTGSFPDILKKVDNHPAQVYSSPDVQVAYLQTKEGKYVARAIVWPDKKVFGRVYPTAENYSRDGWASGEEAQAVQDAMRAMLKGMGWADILEDNSAFDGARIGRVPAPTKLGASTFLMPYLDNSYKFKKATGADKEKFFVLHRNGDYGGGTEGYTRVGEKFTCGECEQKMDTITASGAINKYVVYRQWDGEGVPTAPLDVCGRCARQSYYCASDYNNRYRLSVVDVPREVFDGAYCAVAWIKRQGYYRCAATEQWFDPKVNPPITVGAEQWSREAADRYGFYCRWNETYYKLDDMSDRFSGFPASLDNADIHPGDREVYAFDVPVFINKGGVWTEDTRGQNAQYHFLSRRKQRLDYEALERRRAARKAQAWAGTTASINANTVHAYMTPRAGTLTAAILAA